MQPGGRHAFQHMQPVARGPAEESAFTELRHGLRGGGETHLLFPGDFPHRAVAVAGLKMGGDIAFEGLNELREDFLGHEENGSEARSQTATQKAIAVLVLCATYYWMRDSVCSVMLGGL